jgi:TonB-dependent starch-binding outer membrane protein SusC
MLVYYSFMGLVLQGILVNLLLAVTPAEGQNLRDIKISVKAVNVTLEQALQIIEQKTKFKFSYSKEEIGLNEKANVVVDEESLYNILEVFAKDYGLTFNRINDQIVIRKNLGQTENYVTAVETGNIKGKVVDGATKEPLFGASVTLRGTTIGCNTDSKGNFELENLKPGKYTIAASYVGYSTTTKTIEVSANKTIDVTLPLGQSAVNLDEVIVTGSISERSIRESANPITVISPRELENRNLSSMTNVLETVPGIIISSNSYLVGQGGRWFDQTLASLNIRGSGASTGNKLKVIVDGTEMAIADMLTFLDPEQIEKIEVARGPMSSTLYGAGSAEGIIQIFTKHGVGNLAVNFKTTLTSQESDYQDSNPLNQQYSLLVNGNKGDVGYNFGVNYAVTPISRWTVNNGIDEHDWAFSAGVQGKIADISANLRVQKVSATAGAGLIDKYHRIAVIQGWSDPNSAAIKSTFSDKRYKVNQLLTTLSLKQVLADNLYQNLNVSYNEMSTNSNTFTGTKISTDNSYYYNALSYSYTTTNAKYYMNWTPKFSDAFKADLTAGFDVQDGISNSSYDNYTLPYDDDVPLYGNQKATYSMGGSQTNGTQAVFAEGVWGLWNNLFLTTGYRMEKNKSYGDDLGWYSIPRAGLTYVIELGNFNFKPRVSVGKSTQPVTPMYKVDKVTTTGSQSMHQVGNPDLQPQTQRGWEVGADVFYGSNVSLNFTYYDQVFNNMISTQQIIDPNYYSSYQYINLNEVYNKGIEISAQAIYDRFILNLSYTHLTSVYGDTYPAVSSTSNPEAHAGGRIYGIPSGSFSAQLTYNVPALLPWSSKGGSLTLQYVHNGDEYNQDYVAYYRSYVDTKKFVTTYRVFDGYDRINLRGDYAVVNNIFLFFDIQNLLNNQEMEYYGPLNGRTISFGFNLKY